MAAIEKQPFADHDQRVVDPHAAPGSINPYMMVEPNAGQVDDASDIIVERLEQEGRDRAAQYAEDVHDGTIGPGLSTRAAPTEAPSTRDVAMAGNALARQNEARAKVEAVWRHRRAADPSPAEVTARVVDRPFNGEAHPTPPKPKRWWRP